MKKILCLILCLTMLLGCTSALADEAAAAAAAFEVINMGIYSLHPDYGGSRRYNDCG